jgi:hypothetical protein
VEETEKGKGRGPTAAHAGEQPFLPDAREKGAVGLPSEREEPPGDAVAAIDELPGACAAPSPRRQGEGQREERGKMV